MTVEERLAAVEQRMAKLEGETYTDIERRLVQNSEKRTTAERAEAQTRQTNNHLASLQREIAGIEKREKVSLAWLEETNAKLAAHRATPQPTHGAELAIWQRTREELELTLDEIRFGPGGFGDGYLRQMALRDGEPLLPCLVVTQKRLAALRAELAAAEAAA